ncbi:MAG: hypothetical protein HY429_01530 [Candidatus Levybacteria bacterium]|nr:hypothetical protein [Candidatus Levybacteria bacterium]
MADKHTFFQKEHVRDNGPPERNGEERKLQALVARTEKVLLKISAVFPFDFFPDEIIIDENKVNLIIRQFFFSAHTHSIMIKMIKDVAIECSPLFATFKLVPDGYPGEPIVIKFLKKSEATKARSLILGLMLLLKEGLDPAKVPTEILKKDIEALGKINPID